jgi:hypothetical protein
MDRFEYFHHSHRSFDLQSKSSKGVSMVMIGRLLKLFVTAVAAALLIVPAPVAAQENKPVDLPNGPAKPGFDIKRFRNAGNGWFETFHVKETEPLRKSLDEGRVAADTRVLVTQTGAGRLALLMDQMAYHHIAQGHAGGRDWLATL